MHLKCHQESPKLHKIPSYWKHFFCWHSSESLKKISNLDTCVAGLWVIFIFICFCNFKNFNYSPQCIFNQIGVRLDTHTHTYTPSKTFSLFFCYCCSVAQLCPTICRPHGLQLTRVPCPSLSLRVCSDSCPMSRWCHWVILCYPDSG